MHKKAEVLPSAFVFCSKKSRNPFLFLPSADGRPSADPAARRWRRLYARCERAHWPPSAARESRCSPAGTKGDRTPNMVSCPLLTPLTFLWTRLPAVARLNARGPQGRLVLQGYTLDRSGAFRSTIQTPCTGWPRTVMRGALRKENSGQLSHI